MVPLCVCVWGRLDFCKTKNKAISLIIDLYLTLGAVEQRGQSLLKTKHVDRNAIFGDRTNERGGGDRQID